MHTWKRPWRENDRVVLAALNPAEEGPEWVWALQWAEDVGGPVLETTYGLLARRMRLFPLCFITPERLAWVRISEDAPAPRWQALAPDYVAYTWTPYPAVHLTLEWLVPEPWVVLARLTLHNAGEDKAVVPLGWAAQLDLGAGPGLEPVERRAVQVLEGALDGQWAVVFATGGAEGRLSPFPMLTLDVNLAPGMTRRLRLVHLLGAEAEGAFETARRWAARPWEALVARVGLREARWPWVLPADEDLAWPLAVAQQTVRRLLAGGTPGGWRRREPDGSEPGLSVLEGWYLTVGFLLPGAEAQARALFEAVLATQEEDGWVSVAPHAHPGRGPLASPLLVDWAARVLEALDEPTAATLRVHWFAPLHRFLTLWFAPERDADGDGLPEWQHPEQIGVEALPVWGAWHPASLGADPTTMEDPALWALLYRAAGVLADWAQALGRDDAAAWWRERAATLRAAVQATWDARRAHPLRRDRDTHASPAGRRLGQRRGPGELWLQVENAPPTRLVIALHTPTPVAGAQVLVRGHRADGRPWTETLTTGGRWFEGRVVLTTAAAYRAVESVVVVGVPPTTRVTVSTPDYTAVDLSLLLPLWAGMLTPEQVQQVVRRLQQRRGGYAQPYGLPQVPGAGQRDPAWWAVYPVWQLLVAEGLAACGERALAAQVLERLWRTAAQGWLRTGRFSEAYHARTGAGLGRRDVPLGLPPVAPALRWLGLARLTPGEVVLTAPSPFTFPLRVLGYDLEVLLAPEGGQVRFQDGQQVAWKREDLPVWVRYILG